MLNGHRSSSGPISAGEPAWPWPYASAEATAYPRALASTALHRWWCCADRNARCLHPVSQPLSRISSAGIPDNVAQQIKMKQIYILPTRYSSGTMREIRRLRRRGLQPAAAACGARDCDRRWMTSPTAAIVGSSCWGSRQKGYPRWLPLPSLAAGCGWMMQASAWRQQGSGFSLQLSQAASRRSRADVADIHRSSFCA